MIYVFGPRGKFIPHVARNVTSQSGDYCRAFSPFFNRAVYLYPDPENPKRRLRSENMENAWQFSKAYPKHLDEKGDPTEDYWMWARAGWALRYAERYPMGKGASPVFALWNGEKLDYIAARKRIYIPLYMESIKSLKTEMDRLRKEAEAGDVWLFDFDGYDNADLGMTIEDVIECRERKMGHAFVLAMMINNPELAKKFERM